MACLLAAGSGYRLSVPVSRDWRIYLGLNLACCRITAGSNRIVAVSTFPLLDSCMGRHLDADLAALKPGKTIVKEWINLLPAGKRVETLNALWWLWLDNGCSIVSVPPGSRVEIASIIQDAEQAAGEFDEGRINRIKAAVDSAIIAEGYSPTGMFSQQVILGCNRDLLVERDYSRCIRLLDCNSSIADGLLLTRENTVDGISFGVLFDGAVVAEAHHRYPGLGPENVVEVGVHTALKYRDRGFGKTVVSRLVKHAADLGGEALYACGHDNIPAISLAKSVGFVQYGRQLVFTSNKRVSL